jgi:hypothetical protein
VHRRLLGLGPQVEPLHEDGEAHREVDALLRYVLPHAVGYQRHADLAPLEEDGVAELVVPRDGLWLVMRACRSVKEREVLLERLDANR